MAFISDLKHLICLNRSLENGKLSMLENILSSILVIEHIEAGILNVAS